MNKIDGHKIAAFSQLINTSHKIVIIPHVNPDGDAIGASLALRLVLRNMNKNAMVILPNAFPEFLKWIKGSNTVLNYEEQKDDSINYIADADVLICLDFNDPKRAGGLASEITSFSKTKMMIDHHPYPSESWDILISYPELSSTCELLYRVLVQAELKQYIDKDVAEAIFTGLLTDTGNFSHNASKPYIYEIVADLLRIGADKDKIHSNIYHTFSEDRWRLIGYSLSEKMKILPEFRTGYIALSKEELERFNYQSGDTEGLVNYPLNIKGIVCAVLIMEKDDKVKLSFRSKGEFAVNELSNTHFGGGGHRNAAGGESSLSLDETITKLETVLAMYKDQIV